MEYKAYGKKATTPSRGTRKGMRNSVFVFNKRAAKLRRKVARVARRSYEQGE